MEGNYPMARVCTVLSAPRSTVYHRRARGDQLGCRPGPKTAVSDEELVAKIRQVLSDSSFAGEGYRKVRARLRREHDLRVLQAASLPSWPRLSPRIALQWI